ncbi:MAG TPA: tetratricopeptide repeat protein [Candidatus Acidoferrum sp.]|nr:tetratricopeptide repeat protein [Candidatus Acidoferrum sp.]
MKRYAYSWAWAALVCAVLLAGLGPRAAAQDGGISGQVLDLNAKPWPDVAVTITSDQGTKTEAKTDAKGNYEFHGLRSGTYAISIQLPNQVFQGGQVKVSSGQNVPANFNFKEIVAKNNPDYANQVKKQEEEKQKFQGMKQHFEAGVAALDAAHAARDKMLKAPADQKEPLKQEATDQSTKAVTELEAAKTASNEKDPNLQLIMARLGDAYDAAGRTDDAIGAYKRAIELKPSFAYYNNIGGIYGRAGKIDDATAAYQKAAEVDPAQAAQAWRNFGITMYNANKYKEAVDPLKKATELDPKNPQAWYLLGTVLVGTMGFKKVGDKDVPDVQPGTVEAYQKAVELDPTGPWGQQAKQGLDMLQQIAPGIDTKIGAKKKKS